MVRDKGQGEIRAVVEMAAGIVFAPSVVIFGISPSVRIELVCLSHEIFGPPASFPRKFPHLCLIWLHFIQYYNL